MEGIHTSEPVRAFNPRLSFYHTVLDHHITDRKSRMLVLAAGPADKMVIESLGFSNVVFSNIDQEHSGRFAPYEFNRQNAESLTYPDESFDYVLIHAGLHHLHSPHKGLLEMYRVAGKGVLVIEARDSLISRLLQRIGVVEEYEFSAVRDEGGLSGGVNNGPIPNFVYRWTEREIEKTICSFAPHVVHRFCYDYMSDLSNAKRMSGVRKALIVALSVPYQILAALFPSQRNLFAFFITKTSLQAWLRLEDGELRLG